MWTLEEIAVEMVEVDREVLLVKVSTPAGTLELAGEVRLTERTLHIAGAHVQGLNAGSLGRAGLNAIGRKLLMEEIVIEGSTRTTGRRKGRAPRRIRFPHPLRSASR